MNDRWSFPGECRYGKTDEAPPPAGSLKQVAAAMVAAGRPAPIPVPASMSDPVQIPADAVRVWRGFRATTMALPDFFTRLGTVFVPATVEMQIQVGLDAYFPTVPAGLSGKPDTVPDETAILFWDSQQT